MHYKARTPEEYLTLLQADWRKTTLLAIRNSIRTKGPELQEGVQYGMLAYGHESHWLFHLTAQKHYVSLYVGNIDKIENSRELLKDFSLGKGCIRIKKTQTLPHNGLDEFVSNTIKAWRSGTDTDC